MKIHDDYFWSIAAAFFVGGCIISARLVLSWAGWL